MPRILDGRLSPGELAALRLAANGFTSRQIALRLHSTEAGIHLRLKRAAASLGASTRTHAVALAMARGLIAPADIAQEEPPMPESRVRAAQVYRSASAGRDRIRVVAVTGRRAEVVDVWTGEPREPVPLDRLHASAVTGTGWLRTSGWILLPRKP